MRIVQVATSDRGGGAEEVAWRLFSAFRELGHRSALAVGRKQSDDPDVRELRQMARRRGVLTAHLRTLGATIAARNPRVGRAVRILAGLTEPRRTVYERMGWEEFGFPETNQVLRLLPDPPDILHCHNLHGRFPDAAGYFDLRAIAPLSQRVPTVLTLHDAWLLTGHCAHSFSCERWTAGCGHCPDLGIYPPVRRDGTARNWRRKRAIYRRSRIYLVTPSSWLMETAQRSILAPAIRDARVIPNGVDLAVFRPGDRDAARRAVGLPPDAAVLLFVATGGRNNRFKDLTTILRAAAFMGERSAGERLILAVLGDQAPPERVGNAAVTYFPWVSGQNAVARYYQAADVYVHAAKAETFPNTVLEALACGLPVVATAVGGISEQVRALAVTAGRDATLCARVQGQDEATGLLVPPGDARALADAVGLLLQDGDLRAQLGRNAAVDARHRFDLAGQVAAYLAWYRRAIDDWGHVSPA